MSQEKYIGMDVHQATISVAVMDAQGKLDVTGEICTRWNERESTWRKSGHAHPEVQARADRDDAAAD